MTLIACDGLEYADIKNLLPGTPLHSIRNAQLAAYRNAPDLFSPGEIQAWQEAYDGARGHNYQVRHRYGHEAMSAYRIHRNVTDFETRTGRPYPTP